MPKDVVHSAPEYVVGTDTWRSPDADETALVRSIALPPPTTSRPSQPSVAAAASSILSDGISVQRPLAGRSR